MVTSRAVVGSSGQQERRLAGHRHGDDRPLEHAAGPLERVVVESALRAGYADPAKQLDSSLARLAFRHGVVDAQPLRHLVADRPDGIEARHRVLEDHADAGSTHPGHLRVVQLQQIPPLEHDLPGRDVSRRRRDETQDTAAQHRLPAAGLADDAERPALRDRERHRGVGEDGGIAQPKLGHQPAYVEDGAPGRGGTGRHGGRPIAA